MKIRIQVRSDQPTDRTANRESFKKAIDLIYDRRCVDESLSLPDEIRKPQLAVED